MKIFKVLIICISFTIIIAKPLSTEDLATQYKELNKGALYDPNNYLENTDSILEKLMKINNETRYDTRIFIIDEMKKDREYYDIEEYINKLSYLILDKNKTIEEYSIFALFSIKDRKMRIRTGKYSRELVSDSIA